MFRLKSHKYTLRSSHHFYHRMIIHDKNVNRYLKCSLYYKASFICVRSPPVKKRTYVYINRQIKPISEISLHIKKKKKRKRIQCRYYIYKVCTSWYTKIAELCALYFCLALFVSYFLYMYNISGQCMDMVCGEISLKGLKRDQHTKLLLNELTIIYLHT